MPRLSRAQRQQVRRLSEGLAVDRSILSDTTSRAGFKANQWKVTTVGMEAALARLDAINAVASSVSNQVIGEESKKTVSIIKAKWPVDTGASRARWSTTRVRQGRTTRWVVANDIPYLKYIHRSGSAALLVNTLVPAEIKDLQNRINARILKLIKQSTRARSPLRAQALGILT